MQQIAEFIEVLDRYVSGQIDFSTFKRTLIDQARSAPRFAGAMIAALLAAEREGQVASAGAQDSEDGDGGSTGGAIAPGRRDR